jgi:hypothetical protein
MCAALLLMHRDETPRGEGSTPASFIGGDEGRASADDGVLRFRRGSVDAGFLAGVVPPRCSGHLV